MKKILIIEDDPDSADTMKTLIEEEGYEVVCELDPRKGIKMLEKFDLLLLDIIMPKMTGREVLKVLKDKNVKIPIIVVSAVGMPTEMERELLTKWPGAGFVAKTNMVEDLVKEIRKKIGE